MKNPKRQAFQDWFAAATYETLGDDWRWAAWQAGASHAHRDWDALVEAQDAEIARLSAAVERLQRDCGEAYQVIGAAMYGTPCAYTQDDVERVLDNLSDAASDAPRTHDDLLPWPRVVA